MVFYKCPKCQKVWQYPIDTCPFCIVPVEREYGEKSKVIGVSKVSIPTTFHPKVPYYAAVLQDEAGNNWAHKSMKELKVGEDVIFGSSEERNAVAIWRIKYDFIDAVKNVSKLLSISLNGDSKVLIIPEIFSPAHAYFKENTSPEFLSSVLKFLFDSGVKKENIKIASQSFDDMPVEASAQKSGLLDACLSNGITPFDLAKSAFVKKGNLEISEDVINADIVFNLSVMKIGDVRSVTNAFRAIKKESFLAAKYLRDEKEIIDELNETLSNVISIGEAEYVQRSDGFVSFLGVILGARDSLKLDAIFNEIVMAKDVPPMIKGINREDIIIVGRDIDEVKHNVEIQL